MSVELRLIADPAATYARLVRSPAHTSVVAALRRPLIVALVLGASVAMAATGHAPPLLVLSATVCWSVLVVAQIAIALLTIAGPARRTVGLRRAFDLFFASHAPWSLWMLAVAAWAPAPTGSSLTPVALAAVLPFTLTFRAIVAHFRHVLGLSPADSLRRAMFHQALTWGLLLGFYGTAVALLPRVVEWLR